MKLYMKKTIFFLIVMAAFYVPATIALSCSMGSGTDGPMMNHDADMMNNNEMPHIEHQGDMMAHHSDMTNTTPETDTSTASPVTNTQTTEPEPTQDDGPQGHHTMKSHSPTHSLP
jgi:hypothetical protein